MQRGRRGGRAGRRGQAGTSGRTQRVQRDAPLSFWSIKAVMLYSLHPCAIALRSTCVFRGLWARVCGGGAVMLCSLHLLRARPALRPHTIQHTRTPPLLVHTHN